MLRLPGIQRSTQRKRLLAASGLLLLLSTQGLSQSGRKSSKPPQTPANIPQIADDNSAPKLGARDLAHEVTLLVGREPTSKHLLSEDAIFFSFIKRLTEIRNVTATSIGDIKREATVKRAKTESQSIVVLVQFDVDSFQNGTIILNSPDLDVKISVFAPVTGQEKFKGKVYYKAVGGPMMKKDNWPSGTPIRITTEGVGIEAAEQVRDWLVLEDIKKRQN
jgi:hypothetical protein